MNNFIKICNLRSVIILFALISLNGNAQNNLMYNFPDNWREGKNPAERKQSLQIPESILQNISTIHLLESCLDYPYLSDIYFFENFQTGFNNVLEDFNGLRELLKREEVEKIILNKYYFIEANPNSFDSYTLVEKGQYCSKIHFIELLISQDNILDSLNDNEQYELLLKSFNFLKEKKLYKNVYGYSSYSSSAIITAKLLDLKGAFINTQKNEQMDLKVNRFIDKPVVIDKTLLEYIAGKAESILELKY